MRPALVAAALVVGLLAGLQVEAAIGLRSAAAAGSLARDVSPALGGWVDDGLAPFYPRPLRVGLARRAIDAAEPNRAERWIATIPAGAEHWALAGRLATLRGEPARAAHDFLEADDSLGLERAVDSLARAGDLDGAVAIEREAIARLGERRTQPDALAEAYWQLGVLEAARSTRSKRRAEAQASLAAYRHAVALGPYSLKYLLAAGYQALTLGEPAVATGFFERARAAQPESAEAFAGLGHVALARGDRAAARHDLARARVLDPTLETVRTLAAALGE